MSRIFRSPLLSLALAVVYGLCGGLFVYSCTALAQEPGAAPFVVDVSASARFGAAVALVIAAVGFARVFAARLLAPEPSTQRSKMLCRALALLVGIALGLLGVPEAVSPGIVGQLGAGVLVAAVAVFGRDLLAAGHGWRVEAREANEAGR